MDRRGSGIGRIINSYAEFEEKPIFYSNEYYFQVVLPNRSVASPAQISLDLVEKSQLDNEKSQSNVQKTQFAERKVNSEQDWELIYFREKVIEIVKKIDPELTIHDFRMTNGVNHRNLIFDVVVPFNFRLSDDDVARLIRASVSETDDTLSAVIKVDKKLT